MRDLIRMAVTLFVVGIVSAAALTGVNLLTEPVILARQEQDYMESLQAYFPNIDRYEQQEVAGEKYDLVYDRSDKLIGIVAATETQGYDGTITYNLAVDGEGKVAGIRIVSHTESPGIGDVIAKEEFQSRLIGKSALDPWKIGEDVHTVSGATISTTAMINSIKRVLQEVSLNFLGVEEEIFDITAVPDGTYRGEAPGFTGQPVVVEVTVAGGKITDIRILEWHDTDTYFAEAADIIPQRIKDEQKVEVDTRTGATGSSEGIVNAVLDALTKAVEAGEEGGGEEE